MPLKIWQRLVNAQNNPDVSVMRTKRGRVAVGEEIHSAKTDTPIPGILFRSNNRVGHISTIGRGAGAEDAFRNHSFSPMARTAFGIVCQVWPAFEHDRELVPTRCRTAPNDDFKGGSASFWNLEEDAAWIGRFEPHAGRRADQTDDRNLLLRDNHAEESFDFGPAIVEFGDDRAEICPGPGYFKCADKADLIAHNHGRGLFANLGSQHSVGKNDFTAHDVQSVITTPF